MQNQDQIRSMMCPGCNTMQFTVPGHIAMVGKPKGGETRFCMVCPRCYARLVSGERIGRLADGRPLFMKLFAAKMADA